LQAIKNRLSRAVFFANPVSGWGCDLKGRIDPQVNTTAGHVITQDGRIVGMERFSAFFSGVIRLQKLAMNLSNNTGYLTTL
jgi:hypothetical protein